MLTFGTSPGGGQSRDKDAILTAVLEFREDTEENSFNTLTLGLAPGGVTFKLTPTYTLYMARRWLQSYLLTYAKSSMPSRSEIFGPSFTLASVPIKLRRP